MSKVYTTNLGKVSEHKLVKETPKGFRIIRRTKNMGELNEVVFRTSHPHGWKQFGGKNERFEIATLDKSEAENHAVLQRIDIRERVKLYAEHWLNIAGEN